MSKSSPLSTTAGELSCTLGAPGYFLNLILIIDKA
jgi:hypothetical protein